MTTFAQIAVLAQLGRAGGLFTYRLPESLELRAKAGSLVRVPFTNRQFQGVVCSLEDTCELPRVRDVGELLDPVPVITAHQLRLGQWISEFYASPISDVIGAMIPPGLGRKTVYVLEPGAEPNGHRISSDQERVLDAVRAAGRVALDDVQRALPAVDVEMCVRSLVKRGLLVRLAELAPPRVKARIVRIVSVTDAGLAALESGDGLRRAAKRREVLELVAARGPLASAEISRLYPRAQPAIGALLERGFVHVRHEESKRSPLNGREYVVTHPLSLSGAQQEAYRTILRSLEARKPDIYLLHGVTGSGKTEVYLQATARTIASGRQVIMMVPEISLTPQAVERVAGRFPGRVAVLHSKLSDGERMDEWQRIRHGEVDIVVGPRSALFAPVARPGLIVVDEEHDPSYKQDVSPRYNARDAAAVLGRFTGATVVFGSATPDIGTYHAAMTGRIRLLELPDRPKWSHEPRAMSYEPGAMGPETPRAAVRGADLQPPSFSTKDVRSGDRRMPYAPTKGASTAHSSQLIAQGSRPMPSVEVIDMRQELKSGNRSIFSTSLLEGLNQTLADGHQALLFLNRRGSATVVLCRDCGYVVRCPNCDIPFTFHSVSSRLICHRCDKRAVSPRTCPACGSRRIRYLGVGTQRVEEEVARLFPRARILRWDKDVTGGKGDHEGLLRQFARHEADILVGTQMIAKGLDFPLVTLVGVISADTGLHMPDFRAPERSFQLLTQVAGRAGRSSLPSRVVVQTYTPEHYAIQASKDHDYHRFFREEMSFRESAKYPPFARLMRFVYSSEDEERCRRSASNLRSILERAIAEEGMAGIEVIGPAPCFIARIKNRYYWQVIARGPVAAPGTKLHAVLDYVPPGWVIDVDPVDLL